MKGCGVGGRMFEVISACQAGVVSLGAGVGSGASVPHSHLFLPGLHVLDRVVGWMADFSCHYR